MAQPSSSSDVEHVVRISEEMLQISYHPVYSVYPRDKQSISVDHVEFRLLQSVELASVVLRMIPEEVTLSVPELNELEATLKRQSVLDHHDEEALDGYVLVKSILTGKHYFLTVRDTLPPSDLPLPLFLEYGAGGISSSGVESDNGFFFVIFKCPPPILENVDNSSDVIASMQPTSLFNLFRNSNRARQNSRWRYPTNSQCQHLLSDLCMAVENTANSKRLYFICSLHSIIILNPNRSGVKGEKLKFCLCPYSLLDASDSKSIPDGITGFEIMSYSFSILCLHLALGVSTFSIPDLHRRLVKSSRAQPGLLACFDELRHASAVRLSPEAIHPRLVSIQNVHLQGMPKLGDNEFDGRFFLNPLPTGIKSNTSLVNTLRLQSRTLQTIVSWEESLTKVRVSSLDLPALMHMLLPDGIESIQSAVVETLYTLIMGASKVEMGLIMGPLSECIKVLLPPIQIYPLEFFSEPSVSSNLATKAWIYRMIIMDIVLSELELYGRYTQLANAQMRLLSGSIEHHICSALQISCDGDNHKPSFKVGQCVARICAMMSFHCATFSRRLLSEANVLQFCKILHSSEDMLLEQRQRYIGILLLASDFGTWVDRHQLGSTMSNLEKSILKVSLKNIWLSMEDHVFITRVLPTWHSHLCEHTTQLILTKLQRCCKRTIIEHSNCVKTDSPMLKLKRQKLNSILEWLVTLSWDGCEQFKIASCHSTALAYMYAHYFCTMRLVATSTVAARPSVVCDNDALNAIQSDADSFLALRHIFGETGLRNLGLSYESARLVKCMHYMPQTRYASMCRAALNTINPDNVENLPSEIHIYKHAISLHSLAAAMRELNSEAVDISDFYAPKFFLHGNVPDHAFSVHLEIPLIRRNVDIYSVLSEDDIIGSSAVRRQTIKTRIQGLLFDPVTLTSTTAICKTPHQQSSKCMGTTGVIEFDLQSVGISNDVVVGISWSSAPPNTDDHMYLKPGKNGTSIGLSLKTGCVYIPNRTSTLYQKYPCMPPVPSGSNIKVCIAGVYVYFIVDDVYYPLLYTTEGAAAGNGRKLFNLPLDMSVYPIVRIKCDDIKFSLRNLSNKYYHNNTITVDSIFFLSTLNPVAAKLQSSILRMRLCPHRIAAMQSDASRPNLAKIFPNHQDDLHAMTLLTTYQKSLVQKIRASYAQCPGGPECEVYRSLTAAYTTR